MQSFQSRLITPVARFHAQQTQQSLFHFRCANVTSQIFETTKRWKQTKKIRRGNARKNGNTKRSLNQTIQPQASTQQQEGIFGLTPVIYSVETPPRMYRSPPPPPLNKPGGRKYFFPLSVIFTFGLTVYFYYNNKNDAFEYWETMQTGGELTDDEDYDDENMQEEE